MKVNNSVEANMKLGKRHGETPKEVRHRKEEMRIQRSPHLIFAPPNIPNGTIDMVIQELEKGASRSQALLRVAANLQGEGKAATTIYTYLRNVKWVLELACDMPLEGPNVHGAMKALKRGAAMAEKKKAPAWTMAEAIEVERSLPRPCRLAFRVGLAFAARAGDLDRVTHVSWEGEIWRIELPTTKMKGVTGFSVASTRGDWVETLGLSEWVAGLRKGQEIIPRKELILLLKGLEGRLHAMRRTAINLRLQMGHTPEEVRESTLHTSNAALYNYVGASSGSAPLGGKGLTPPV
jgi:hypothetical protein